MRVGRSKQGKTWRPGPATRPGDLARRPDESFQGRELASLILRGCSFVRSFFRSFVRSFVRLFLCSMDRSFIHLFVFAFVRSFVHFIVRSFVRLLPLPLCLASISSWRKKCKTVNFSFHSDCFQKVTRKYSIQLFSYFFQLFLFQRYLIQNMVISSLLASFECVL